MIAVTQIRHPGSDGRIDFDRKLADGCTRREAMRSSTRQISDLVDEHLVDEHLVDEHPGRIGGQGRAGTRRTGCTPLRSAPPGRSGRGTLGTLRRWSR
jgi:hypothetical protein